MTVSTPRNRTAYPLRAPGVDFQARPREPEAPFARTDVAGFIGFGPSGSAPGVIPCADYEDYRRAFGDPADDGTLLGHAVRAFFVNGGARCWVATVPRPDPGDPSAVERARLDMVGLAGSSEVEATGLERLLLIDEVSLVDAPDLYARRVDVTHERINLPGVDTGACFQPCADVRGGIVVAAGTRVVLGPLYDDEAVFATQKAMLARCVPERWRVLLLLAPPLEPDGTGGFAGPSPDEAAVWRDRFDDLVKNQGFAEPEGVSCAALYYPWVRVIEDVGGPVFDLPPTSIAAGVIARRDLARGPFVAPANESVLGAVQLTWPLNDADHGRLYLPDPDRDGFEVPAINLLRAFPGYGIQVWGARTLSTDFWLRYLPVRRGLSAIQRRMKAALDPLAFEPNTPLLWARVAQLAFEVLLPVFESGALRGATPQEAFYVKCDSGNNPPEAVGAGQLLCEVGVAIAAPAEYLVFRVGRIEGTVHVSE